MSYYTYAYPTDYDYSSYKDSKELRQEIEELTKDVNNYWLNLKCIAIASPASLFPKSANPSEEAIGLFNSKWNKFITAAFNLEYLYRLKQFWQIQEDHEDYIEKYPDGDGYKYSMDLGRDMTDEEYRDYIAKERANWKPYIWYNHFEYARNPEYGIEETTKYINDSKEELLMMCFADNDLHHSEEYDNDFNAISNKLDSIKEWLDTNINANYFAQMCVKYSFENE